MPGDFIPNQPQAAPAVENPSNAEPESTACGTSNTGNPSHRPLPPAVKKSAHRPPGNTDSTSRRNRTPLQSNHTPRSALGAIKAMKKTRIPRARRVLREIPHQVCIKSLNSVNAYDRFVECKRR